MKLNSSECSTYSRQEITFFCTLLGHSQPVSRTEKGSACRRDDVIMTGRKQNRTSSSKNSVEGSSEYCSQCRALIGGSTKSAPRLIPKHIKLIWKFLIESYSNSGIFYENAGLCPALRPLLWKYLCK